MAAIPASPVQVSKANTGGSGGAQPPRTPNDFHGKRTEHAGVNKNSTFWSDKCLRCGMRAHGEWTQCKRSCRFCERDDHIGARCPRKSVAFYKNYGIGGPSGSQHEPTRQDMTNARPQPNGQGGSQGHNFQSPPVGPPDSVSSSAPASVFGPPPASPFAPPPVSASIHPPPPPPFPRTAPAPAQPHQPAHPMNGVAQPAPPDANAMRGLIVENEGLLAMSFRMRNEVACLQQRLAAAEQHPPPMVDGRLQAENAALRQNLQAAEDEVRFKDAEMADLRQHLQAAEDSVSSMDAEMEVLQHKLREAKQNRHTEGQCLRAEIAELQQKVRSADDRATAAQKGWSADKAKWKSDVNKQTENSKTIATTIRGLRDKLKDVRAEKERFEREKERFKREKEHLNREKESFERENQLLRTEIEAQVHINGILIGKNKKLRNEVESLGLTNADLNELVQKHKAGDSES
ncbi:hypothetical protein HDK77DRAFT_191998 [Phyllosticta capitalensis]|uniref:CCHC-type domain-containing protein n=2 Tax=Phyllosticta capitalensis TaxID=121624 RepID=A0ABR1YW61_9PEZI